MTLRATKRRLALGAIALLLGIAGGCATKDRRVEIAELKRTLEPVNTRFVEAFARRDVAALGQLYTADAEAYPPGSAPVVGRALIQEMWKGVVAMVARVQLTTVEVDGNGETAWETGRYEMFGTNGATVDEGTYIAIWKREADGWKISRHMWSSNSPPQADATGTSPPATGK